MPTDIQVLPDGSLLAGSFGGPPTFLDRELNVTGRVLADHIAFATVAPIPEPKGPVVAAAIVLLGLRRRRRNG